MIVLPAAGFGAGSVFLALFGLPFLAFGLLALASVLGVSPVEVEGTPVAKWVVGAFFTAFGVSVAGRGFNERTHAHTALYYYGDTVYRDPDGVPIELALDHHFAGSVTVALQRTDGVSADELAQWLRTEGMPPVLDGGPVALGSTWTPEHMGDNTSQAPMDLGTPAGGDDRSLQLFFTDTDVRESWDRFVDYGERVAASGLATVVGAAPFHRTVVGTDTYTDQLW